MGLRLESQPPLVSLLEFMRRDGCPPSLPPSHSLTPVVPTLDHRASVKRFVSLQFLNPIHSLSDSLDEGSARCKATTYTNTE
jgi:hypothetical protein